ncbi:MAG: dihydrodipicolinate synthase family protein [Verrucomicrobiota bacterium]
MKGLYPVFQTPYHNDLSIDFDTLSSEIDWLFENGAQGITMAMVSETLRLSSEERDELASKACEFTGDRGGAVISVGAESTHTAVRHARHAEAAGAAAVMVIPPIATALSNAEVVAYFTSIIEAISIPLIVQDASGYVGKPLPIQTQAQLLKDFGADRVFFKPEATPIGPNLSALRDATDGQAVIFEGSGGICLVDSYRRGIAGTMPGAEIIKAQVALWNALEAGDDASAYRLSTPIASLISLQTSLDGFLAVEKYLLKKQGIFKNTLTRGPVSFHLDPETAAEVDRLYGLLEAELA